MSMSKKTAKNLLLSFALLLVGFSLRAGEPAPAEARDEAEEPKFRFEPLERRDPFTYTKAISAPALITPTSDSLNPNGPNSLPPRVVEEKKRQAEAICVEAEQSLTNSQLISSNMAGAQVVLQCNKGLELFKDVGNIPELQTVRENLLRIRKAGERLRLRQEAERDFERLNIRITGVVAREKNPQAIINGAIVSKGDVVGMPTDANDTLVVEAILPEQVIFIFRGFRFAQSLSQIGR